MEITDVKVIPVDDEKLKAFVSIVFDQSFVVTDIKIINGPKGLFVSMPSKKRKDGTFKDIAHPLNNQMRQYLEDKVLTVYRQQVASAPGAAQGSSGERRAARPRRRGRRGRARATGPRATAGAAEKHLSRNRLGRGQAVRRGALDPVFEGSNPSAPAIRAGGGQARAGGYGPRAEGLQRDCAPGAGRSHRPVPGGPSRPCPPLALQRRRGLVPDPGQRARRRRLRRAAHRARRSTRT